MREHLELQQRVALQILVIFEPFAGPAARPVNAQVHVMQKRRHKCNRPRIPQTANRSTVNLVSRALLSFPESVPKHQQYQVDLLMAQVTRTCTQFHTLVLRRYLDAYIG